MRVQRFLQFSEMRSEFFVKEHALQTRFVAGDISRWDGYNRPAWPAIIILRG